jgi:hypothetical protein
MMRILSRYFNRLYTLSTLSLALLAFFMLLCLMVLSIIKAEEENRNKLIRLQNSQEHINQEITLGFIKIDNVGKNQASAHDRFFKYRLVFRPPIQLNSGERYSVIGSITVDGSIKIKQIMHHPYRTLKYAISALSLILVVYIGRKYLRWDIKTKTIMIKNKSSRFI